MPPTRKWHCGTSTGVSTAVSTRHTLDPQDHGANTGTDPFISDFQCASEAKLDQRGDKMKSDEMAGLKDYLHRMRDGKDAVDTIPREVQILLESAA